MRQSLLRWGSHVGVILTLLAAMTLPQLADAASGAATHEPAVPRTYLSPLSPAQIAALSANQDQKVIVLMKNQYSNVPGAGSELSQRESTLAADQAPITGELHTLHAAGVHAYQFVNAIAATTSAAEVARLSADPDVQAVVPDVPVQGPTVTESVSSMEAATGGTEASAAAPAPAVPPIVSGTAAGVCPTDPTQPILEPEALQLMNVNFGPGSSQPSASQLANGAGVKIAVFPDGLDPNIPDFMRGGTSAIFDYQDFSGEGINAVTGGEEAFGDASSIIAQGNETYNLNGEVDPAFPLPANCNIKIEGVAPGASVAVMKVFGDSNAAFNSVILQGIDYAVTHDHVDILSESFGENLIPNPGEDPIAVADSDAVAAGITVVASTGDAGLTNTISTPADAPGVISAGASTSYREYAQTGSYGYTAGGGDGWESDNVSSPSSSGETDSGPNTIDVLAPGENGWADCSTNTTTFTECADAFNGPDPQPIVAFGGTSEAAPLTAGVAALVIEAYRNSHGGASPSPELVKQIIMSSAQDLGIPADEEGAGLVDGLAAVQDAMSVDQPSGSSSVTGTGLVYSPNSISLTGGAGQSSVTPVTVTNVGTTTQTVTPSVRELGPATTIARGTLTLNDAADPTMLYQSGVVIGDVHLLHFTVPAGTQRLLSQIAWQTATQVTGTVRESLFDPSGDMAAQSRPQGDGGGFGQVEVRDPAPGSWTMLTFDAGVQLTNPASVRAPYTGPLAYTITGQSYRTVPGSVWPQSELIAPGASATFSVRATAPSAPGDLSESLVFGSNVGTPGDPSLGSVPIVMRALVTLGDGHGDGHNGGAFSGTITGGNAREPLYGQDLIYQFDVPHDVHNQVLSVNVAVADPGYQILGILSDPNFSPVDAESTISSVSAQNFQTLTLSWLDPVPGRWTLDLAQVNNVSSGVTGARIRGTVSLGPPQAVARGLPEGQRLEVSSTVNASVAVTNNGTEPEAYSIDPRLTTTGAIPLASLVTPTDVPLPVTNTATIPQFVVPPFTTGLEMLAESTVPIAMDTSPAFGTPDVEAVSSGDTALATLVAPDIPASEWSCGPSEIGPFSGPVPTTTYECGAAALTDTFDQGVNSDTGNIWSALEGETTSYAPLVLSPGQTGTIGVTLTVTGTPHQQVNGFLAVETFNPNTFSSDQVAALPYSYRSSS